MGASLTSTESTVHMQSGMRSFRNCDVTGSIQAFDEALRLDPAIRPYLWQRGLSLYYAGDTTLAVWGTCCSALSADAHTQTIWSHQDIRYSSCISGGAMCNAFLMVSCSLLAHCMYLSSSLQKGPDRRYASSRGLDAADVEQYEAAAMQFQG